MIQVSVTLRRMDTDQSKTAFPNISHSIETDSSDSLQVSIAEELVIVLNKCSFKVNQRLLLRDLFVSNIASPFLLAPAVISHAVSGSLLIPPAISPNISSMSVNVTTSTSNLQAMATTPTPSDNGSVVTGASKLKSNIFNNSVPPRRRPPIPSLSVAVKKDGTSGVGIGDVPQPVPAVDIPALPVAAESAVKVKVTACLFNFTLCCSKDLFAAILLYNPYLIIRIIKLLDYYF